MWKWGAGIVTIWDEMCVCRSTDRNVLYPIEVNAVL